MARGFVCVLVIVAACGDGGGASSSSSDGGVLADAGAIDAAPGIDANVLPDDTVPCDLPAEWPLSVRSTAHPAIVHYRTPDEEPMARQVLGLLDHSWDVEVGTLGFRPPLDDGGGCGPDGNFDAFLWRGHEECYVDVLDENLATPYDDRTSYLVVDPWGPYGGAILDTTVAHEFNHALQAADDWSDAAVVYEMTAAFIEDLVYNDDNEYVSQVVDFQAHPEWGLDRDDDYQTWYMYGALLYLRFVRDHYYAGDGSFAGLMWLDLRSPADDDEPDFEDALDQILRAHAGVGFVDSVAEFARWRYYTGAHDDGAHFVEGATFAEPTRLASVTTAGARVALGPQALGSQYVDLARVGSGPSSVTVSLENASSLVDWVVDVVPGTHGDGDRLDLTTGPQTITVSGSRTLVITALPHASYDPDTRSDEYHHATLVIAPP